MKHAWTYLALMFFCLSTSYVFAKGYATAASEVFVIRDLGKDGMTRVKDEALTFSISRKRPLDVSFVIYHRSALDQKIITVEGLIKKISAGEDACPSKTQGCGQPRIFLVDSLDVDSPLLHLMVVLDKDDSNGYVLGQAVQIQGKVHAGKKAVHLEKI